MTQAAGSNFFSAYKRLVMPFVVAEVDTSTKMGMCEVGKPYETGLGVKTGSKPPKGATLLELGSEQCNCISMP